MPTFMRRLLWRRRVRAAHAWRDEQRAAYLAAVQRLAAMEPAGIGTIRQPRS